MALSSTVAMEKSATSMFIRPASSFEKSSISFKSVSKLLPDVWMVVRHSRCSLVRLVSSSRPAKPSTAFSGVRISWLIVARNSDFAWLAT